MIPDAEQYLVRHSSSEIYSCAAGVGVFLLASVQCYKPENVVAVERNKEVLEPAGQFSVRGFGFEWKCGSVRRWCLSVSQPEMTSEHIKRWHCVQVTNTLAQDQKRPWSLESQLLV